jgi:peptidoglycan hydrolase CwlO-like protein
MRASEEIVMDIARFRWLRTIALLLIMAPFFLAVPADAADDKKGGRDKEMARRVQQLQQEKSEMNAKLKAVSDKAEELSKTAEQTKRGAEQSKRELAGARKSNAELTVRLQKLEEEHRALQASFDETSAARTQLDGEKRNLERVAAEQLAVMGRQSRMIDTCRASNVELQQMGSDLLARLRAATKRSADPMFGLAEVDGFNFDQEYRDKLNRLRFDAGQTTR